MSRSHLAADLAVSTVCWRTSFRASRLISSFKTFARVAMRWICSLGGHWLNIDSVPEETTPFRLQARRRFRQSVQVRLAASTGNIFADSRKITTFQPTINTMAMNSRPPANAATPRGAESGTACHGRGDRPGTQPPSDPMSDAPGGHCLPEEPAPRTPGHGVHSRGIKGDRYRRPISEGKCPIQGLPVRHGVVHEQPPHLVPTIARALGPGPRLAKQRTAALAGSGR